MNIFENLDKMDNFLENRIHQEQLKKKITDSEWLLILKKLNQ